IEPTYPETGFGYIEAVQSAERVKEVRKFHEKPDKETAEEYLGQGNFYWNSGMFCFKAKTLLEELQATAPEIYEACKMAFDNAHREGERLLRIRHEDMAAIPDESIDYAVMEKSDKVRVVPCDIGWSDLGSFDALYEELPKDEKGNTLNGSHIPLDSRNNLVIGSDRTIATVDVEDLMIVDTVDALLVSRKGSSQKVKEIVKELKRRGSELPTVHLTAHRPWGTYTVLEDTPGYKIKRIVVKPGKRLSLQKHFHRSEHWIVVSGTATVTVGDETKLIRPNESTYIRMGEVHRLANEGKIPVVLIEAQVGEYTGEDDIVRLDDDFRRN
ncbi:mannose-1-phosphate guanylyltransferase/mannose-6-phosphate isomerase, partial [Hydrogenimonas sp.]